MKKNTKITIGSITTLITAAGTAIGVVVKELKDDESVINSLRAEVKQDTVLLNNLIHDIKDTLSTNFIKLYSEQEKMKAAINIALRQSVN